MPLIRYIGPLSEVVMTKHGKSAPDPEAPAHARVKRGEPVEVTDEAAARLVGEAGGWCWENVVDATFSGKVNGMEIEFRPSPSLEVHEARPVEDEQG